MMSSMFLAVALFFSATLAMPFFPHHAAVPYNGTADDAATFPTATRLWKKRQLYPTAFPSGTAPWDKRQLYPTAFPTGTAPWKRRQLAPFPTGTAPWNDKRQNLPTLLPSGVALPTGLPLAQIGQEVAEDAAVLSPRFEGARRHRAHFYPIGTPDAPAPAPTGAGVRAAGPTARFAQPSGASLAAGPTARFAAPTGAYVATPTGY